MKPVHFCVYDDLADWEPGYLLAELHSGRFTGTAYPVRTVAVTTEPITTMGGVRMLPDSTLAELDPTDSALLILPGGSHWDSGGGAEFVAVAERFLAAGVPVAAICGATAGLAAAGILDDREHTSAAAEYLAATGYAGGAHYVEQRAVCDRDVITAGPQSPVQFATATLRRLGLLDERTAQAYEGLFDRGDPAAFGQLMQAAAPA